MNLPGLGREGGVEGDLETLEELILKVDGGRQLVVGVPLLSEGQPVLLELVLGLQIGRDLSAISIGSSAGSKFNAGRSLGLELEFHKAEVVALAENIARVLAQIAVGGG